MGRNINTRNAFPVSLKVGKTYDQIPVLNSLACQIPSINSQIITGLLGHVEDALAQEMFKLYCWSWDKPGS